MGNISTILNIILGLLTVYLYIENKKLKGFEIEKNIKIKSIEIDELMNEYSGRKAILIQDMANRGLTFSSFRTQAENNLKEEYENKTKKLTAKLVYLEKLKRCKWIFNK
ncbi:MAG: hypothetical protein WC608_03755 [Parcubacteria group bacterium]